MPSNTLQVAVEIPRKGLLAKDYLNHKYHARRLLYLEHIARVLQASNLHKHGVRLRPRGNNLRCPCICYTDQASNISVLVSTSLPSDSFPCSKLAPTRNCLRSAAPPAKGKDGATDPQPAATPIYNASILSELLHHSMCTDLATVLGSTRLQVVACLCNKLLSSQVEETLHHPSLLDGLLIAFASAVQDGKVV
jgi:hypothetical protein